MNTDNIWTDKDRRCGKPCINQTRMGVGNVLAEIAEGDRSLDEICADFDLDKEVVIGALQDVGRLMDRMVLNTEYMETDTKFMVQPHVRLPREEGVEVHLPASYIVTELAAWPEDTIRQVSDDFFIPEAVVAGVLWELAWLFDRDWSKGQPEDPTDVIVNRRDDE